MENGRAALYRRALGFAGFILIYNVFEGIVSVLMGINDGSLTLFGFGVDSFVEVTSNLGVIMMIKRIQKNPGSDRGEFEKKALKITGYGFYVLSAGLVIGAILNIIQKHRPESTMWGIIISLLSIGIMYYVSRSQIKTGQKLNSSPIIADAKCTMVCVYMSVVLLVSSFIYELSGFAYVDAIGAIGLVYFSIREGREAFEKAKGKECCDTCG
jgi:divalent metal cation (Fe/Co/Zn/Cd) transporter